MRRSIGLLPLLVALSLLVGGDAATESAKKFPQPGSLVPGSFSPLIVNGPWKDGDGKPVYRHHSVVADYGLKPVVLIFSKSYKDATIGDFLKKLEAKVEAYHDQDLCGAAIFLCYDDKRPKAEMSPEEQPNVKLTSEQLIALTSKLIELANQRENIIAQVKDKLPGLKRVLVGIDAPAGPKGFAMGDRSSVTVILYDKFQVRKSYSYNQDQDNKDAAFDATAAASILKEIDGWMAARKAKARPGQ